MPNPIDPQRRHAEQELAAAKKHLKEMRELSEATRIIRQAENRVRRAELTLEEVDASAAQLRAGQGFSGTPPINPMH